MTLQIIVIAFIFFVISRTLFRYYKRQISHKLMLIWVFLWSTALFFVFFPGQTTHIAKIVGIGRGVDVIMYVAIVFLFYIASHLYLKIDMLDRNITELTMKLAHKKYLDEHKEVKADISERDKLRSADS